MTLELKTNGNLDNSLDVLEAFHEDRWFRKSVPEFEFAPFVRKSELPEGEKVRITYLRSLGEFTHAGDEVDLSFSVTLKVHHGEN